jgi:hypothetical protein
MGNESKDIDVRFQLERVSTEADGTVHVTFSPLQHEHFGDGLPANGRLDLFLASDQAKNYFQDASRSTNQAYRVTLTPESPEETAQIAQQQQQSSSSTNLVTGTPPLPPTRFDNMGRPVETPPESGTGNTATGVQSPPPSPRSRAARTAQSPQGEPVPGPGTPPTQQVRTGTENAPDTPTPPNPTGGPANPAA